MSLNDEALMNTLSCTLGAAGYPCGENPINIVSLSLATAGLALLMVSVVICALYDLWHTCYCYLISHVSYLAIQTGLLASS